jgi:hypothetical protein
MSERDELVLFYQSLKNDAPADLSPYTDLRGPDLICLDDEYLSSSPRIAIIGKEQFGWDYSYPEFVTQWTIPGAMSCYAEFDFAISYHSTPFWRFFRAVRIAAFPDEPEKRRKVLWLNLVKFVASDASPIFWKPYAESAFTLQQEVFKAELKIARPDVCLFVTGPNYDDVLERYFPGIAFDPLELPVRQFAKLTHADLPEHSYRLYHPNYLNRSKPRWETALRMITGKLGLMR